MPIRLASFFWFMLLLLLKLLRTILIMGCDHSALDSLATLGLWSISLPGRIRPTSPVHPSNPRIAWSPSTPICGGIFPVSFLLTALLIRRSLLWSLSTTQDQQGRLFFFGLHSSSVLLTRIMWFIFFPPPTKTKTFLLVKSWSQPWALSTSGIFIQGWRDSRRMKRHEDSRSNFIELRRSTSTRHRFQLAFILKVSSPSLTS